MTRVIEPLPGRVLVKLGVSAYGDIPVPPKDYDSLMEGIIIKVSRPDEEIYGYLVGRIGHFKKYKDDLVVGTTAEGGKLALIPIQDIDGTSYEEE